MTRSLSRHPFASVRSVRACGAAALGFSAARAGAHTGVAAQGARSGHGGRRPPPATISCCRRAR